LNLQKRFIISFKRKNIGWGSPMQLKQHMETRLWGLPTPNRRVPYSELFRTCGSWQSPLCRIIKITYNSNSPFIKNPKKVNYIHIQDLWAERWQSHCSSKLEAGQWPTYCPSFMFFFSVDLKRPNFNIGVGSK
jgi:hypothetical protein